MDVRFTDLWLLKLSLFPHLFTSVTAHTNFPFNKRCGKEVTEGLHKHLRYRPYYRWVDPVTPFPFRPYQLSQNLQHCHLLGGGYFGINAVVKELLNDCPVLLIFTVWCIERFLQPIDFCPAILQSQLLVAFSWPTAFYKAVPDHG